MTARRKVGRDWDRSSVDWAALRARADPAPVVADRGTGPAMMLRQCARSKCWRLFPVPAASTRRHCDPACEALDAIEAREGAGEASRVGGAR